jgi:hypothetical protein
MSDYILWEWKGELSFRKFRRWLDGNWWGICTYFYACYSPIIFFIHKIRGLSYGPVDALLFGLVTLGLLYLYVDDRVR